MSDIDTQIRATHDSIADVMQKHIDLLTKSRDGWKETAERLMHELVDSAKALEMMSRDRDGIMAANVSHREHTKAMERKYADLADTGLPPGVKFNGPQILGSRVLMLFTDLESKSTFGLHPMECDFANIEHAAKLKRATHNAALQLPIVSASNYSL